MSDAELRERLALIEQDALTLAARLAVDLDEVAAARDSSNVDDEHDPEGSTIAFERAQVEAIRRSALQRAAEAGAAVRRLAEGGYGFCASCGRPIGQARLDARPTAALCIECA